MMICAECGSTEDDDPNFFEESTHIYAMCDDCYNNPPETTHDDL